MLQKNMWTELRDKLLHNSEQFTSTESSDITSARGPPLKYFNPSKIFLAPSVWAEFIIQLNLTPHRARVQIKSFHSEAFSVRSLALISPSNHVKIATACSTSSINSLIFSVKYSVCVCVSPNQPERVIFTCQKYIRFPARRVRLRDDLAATRLAGEKSKFQSNFVDPGGFGCRAATGVSPLFLASPNVA